MPKELEWCQSSTTFKTFSFSCLSLLFQKTFYNVSLGPVFQWLALFSSFIGIWSLQIWGSWEFVKERCRSSKLQKCYAIFIQETNMSHENVNWDTKVFLSWCFAQSLSFGVASVSISGNGSLCGPQPQFNHFTCITDELSCYNYLFLFR